jgi:group II intron reverse transcriptase/maturase
MSAIAEVPARVLAAQLPLAQGWEKNCAKSGMPGADGVRVSRFAKNAPAHLRILESRLARETYRPHPLRVAELEKKNGSRRLLLVPSVADRVIQTAAALWLGARWNPQFDPSSFAYRPGMGVHDALRALAELRDRGLKWVLDADIRSFFDSIDHTLLLHRLEAWLGSNSPMFRWLTAWTRVAVWDGESVWQLDRGVPQGSPLSPLLANYYLDPFDARMRAAKISFIRYADDFLVLAGSPFEVEEARRVVEEVLRDWKLELSEQKTRITSFAAGFRFLGAEIRGDQILLPFAMKKTPKKPVWVAPVIPPQILRAWRTGHLVARSWVWQPHRAGDASEPLGRPPGKRAIVLDSLAGNGSAIARLRGGHP